MRKITSLFALFLFFIGTAVAQITSLPTNGDMCYNIKTVDRGWWMVESGGTAVTSTTKAGYATSSTDKKQLFQFKTVDGVTYLYSTSEKKYVSKSGQYTTLTDEPDTSYPVTLQATTNASYPTVVTLGGSYQCGVSNGYNPAIITFWNDLADAGNQCAIVEVGTEEEIDNAITVTYNVILDGEVVATQSGVAAIAGKAPELPSTLQKMYCTYTYDVDVLTLGTTVVNATATPAAPFEFSADVASAKWYYMSIRGGRYVYYNADNSDVRTNGTKEATSDAYQWAFIGDPYNGVKVVNKATGTFLDNTETTVQLTATGYAWTLVGLNATTFGLYNGSNYINEQNHDNHNLIYWTQFTYDTGSQFKVEEVPSVVVNVTYDLYVDGTKVDSKTVEQGGNSEVAVPADLTAAYSTLAWNFTTEGTVGTTDCTINVTATLKPGVVTNVDALSDTKIYTIVCARGTLGTDGSNLATDSKVTLTGTTFALPTFGTDKYLYSVADNKFVSNTAGGELTEDISTLGALVINGNNATAESPLFFLGMGSNGVNVSLNYTTGIVINSWTTRDPGNQYVFIETGDFDPATAEAALANYFNNVDMTAQVMAEFVPYVLADPTNLTSPTPAESLGKPFGITTTAAMQLATTYQTNLTQGKFNLEDYNAIKAFIEANIIYPESGYYRLKSKRTGTEGTSYGYMAVNSESKLVGNVTAEDAAADAGTIFYVKKNGEYYSFQAQGVYGAAAAQSTPVNADASEHNFILGHAGPGYGYIKTQSGVDRSCYHAAATQSYYVVGWEAGADASQWVFEPATKVDVTLGVNDGTNYYGTINFPFAVEINDADICKIEADYDNGVANYSSVGTQLPANTGAFLVGTQEKVEATIVDGGALGAIETGLAGHNLAAEVPEALVLNLVESQVGFYTLKSGFVLGANKAYLAATESSVRALVLSRADATAITNVETAKTEGAIYDLSGRRVKSAQNGLYIVNGKKVLVK